jgi:AAA ATPase-like protein
MLPEPNFPVRPDEFVGRRQQIEIFLQSLQQGLVTGRTASFAVLGDWGIGKSSLLLNFAALCSQPPFAMLPVFISVSTGIRDYLRLAETLLDKFADALLAVPKMQARLRTKLQNWRFKRITFGGVGLERESPRLFLSLGSSLLRHMLTEAWDHFLRPAGLNGAVFFLDDLQNITSISKEDLALMIRDQFQSFGIEGMNYSVCFSAKPDYFAGTKALADPAVRFYTKFYLEPFTFQETLEYAHSVFGLSLDISEKVAAWLQEKTLGHAYFLACICKYLMGTAKQIEVHKLETNWPAILDHLGREKFRADISKLSAKELELIHQFGSLGEGEVSVEQFGGKFQREYFARLVGKGLLIRTGRGRYKLYHPLFREFLQQTQ